MLHNTKNPTKLINIIFRGINNSLKYVAMKGISVSCASIPASRSFNNHSFLFRSGLVDSDSLSGEWRYHMNLQVS